MSELSRDKAEGAERPASVMVAFPHLTQLDLDDFPSHERLRLRLRVRMHPTVVLWFTWIHRATIQMLCTVQQAMAGPA